MDNWCINLILVLLQVLRHKSLDDVHTIRRVGNGHFLNVARNVPFQIGHNNHGARTFIGVVLVGDKIEASKWTEHSDAAILFRNLILWVVVSGDDDAAVGVMIEEDFLIQISRRYCKNLESFLV